MTLPHRLLLILSGVVVVFGAIVLLGVRDPIPGAPVLGAGIAGALLLTERERRRKGKERGRLEYLIAVVAGVAAGGAAYLGCLAAGLGPHMRLLALFLVVGATATHVYVRTKAKLAPEGGPE